MAKVISSAQVTVGWAVDVLSVTRFYKLASATSATPSHPTSSNLDGWGETEPDVDTTKVLYTCDRTIFSDGTEDWSKVSKSTSYEAAKQAKSAADAAKGAADANAKVLTTKVDTKAFNEVKKATDSNTATITQLTTTTQTLTDRMDNLKIGGRNLLYGTGTDNPRFAYSTANGSHTQTNSADGVSTIVVTEVCTSWSYISYKGWHPDVVIKPDTDYVLSFDLTSDSVLDNFRFRFMRGDATYSVTKSSTSLAKNVAGRKTRVAATMHTTDDAVANGQVVCAYIGLPKGTHVFQHFKLEYGTVPTDWTPAPEDMATQESLTTVSNTVNQVKQTAEKNTSTISNLTTTVNTKGGKTWSVPTSCSYTLAQWQGYAKPSYTGTWTTSDAASLTSVKPGDVIYLTGAISDGAKGTAILVAAVNSVSGSSVNCTSRSLMTSPDSVENLRKTVTSDYATKSSLTQTKDAIELAASKAYTTKTEFGDLKIGGRNLVLGTSNEWSDWWTPGTGTNQTHAWANSLVFDEAPEEGTTFAVSFDVEWTKFAAESGKNLAIRYQGSVDGSWSHPNAFVGAAAPSAATAQEDAGTHHVEYLVAIPMDYPYKSFYLGIRVDNSDGTGKLRWRNVKIEEGTRATDWTPAPEDMATQQGLDDVSGTANAAGDAASAAQKAASAAQQAADKAKETADAANEGLETVSRSMSELSVNAESISSKVTTLEETTVPGLQTRVDNVESSISQTASEIRADFSTTASGLDGRLKTIESGVSVEAATDTTPLTVTLGASNSPLKTVLTNEKMSFYDGDAEVAYVSGAQFHMVNGVVTNELLVGGWKWYARPNGNLAVRYVG